MKEEFPFRINKEIADRMPEKYYRIPGGISARILGEFKTDLSKKNLRENHDKIPQSQEKSLKEIRTNRGIPETIPEESPKVFREQSLAKTYKEILKKS